MRRCCDSRTLPRVQCTGYLSALHHVLHRQPCTFRDAEQADAENLGDMFALCKSERTSVKMHRASIIASLTDAPHDL